MNPGSSPPPSHTDFRAKYETKSYPMQKINYHVSINIRFQRKRAGMTMEEVAEKMDVTYQTVWRWENRNMCPLRDQLLALAGLYNCDPSDFYKGVEGM